MHLSALSTQISNSKNQFCKYGEEYGGSIPGDNRHWSNSGRHPWKAAGVQSEPNAASSLQHLTSQMWLDQAMKCDIRSYENCTLWATRPTP